MSPKEPEPIFRPSRYFFPTRSSIVFLVPDFVDDDDDDVFLREVLFSWHVGRGDAAGGEGLVSLRGGVRMQL